MKRQHDVRRGVARRRRTVFAAALPVAIPLILAAVAVAALVAYQGLGSAISTLAGNVASDL